MAHGCSSSTSSNSSSSTVSQAANAPKVETTQAKLGFIALTDSAPLIIAKEKAKFGSPGINQNPLRFWPMTCWVALDLNTRSISVKPNGCTIVVLSSRVIVDLLL